MWNNHKWVGRSPFVTAILVESANISQLWRIWAEGSALGQSLIAWLCVGLALLLRWNFYRVVAPKQWLARWCIIGSLVINVALIISVILYRG